MFGVHYARSTGWKGKATSPFIVSLALLLLNVSLFPAPSDAARDSRSPYTENQSVLSSWHRGAQVIVLGRLLLDNNNNNNNNNKFCF
jgi:hypothetical protein